MANHIAWAGGAGRLLIVAGLTLAATNGLALAAETKTAGKAETVAEQPLGMPVVVKTITDDKAVFATVRSSDTAEARARISGTIVTLKVDDGSFVKRGQLIAVVVDDKLKLQEGSTEAAIKAANARLVKAAADLKRGKNLLKRGVVAKATLDQLQSAYDVASNDLKSAEAQQSVLQEQMKQGQVLAPDDGRVLKVPVTKDSVIMAGESIATIAANQFILRLELPERHARFIKTGDSVMVGARGLDPLEKAVGEGIVSKVYPELDNGRVIADVEIPHLGDYFVGERARVRIAADKRQAIIIPADYTFQRFGLDYVKLARAKGEPVDIVVQLGQPVLLGPGRGDIEVLAGLNPGDRLIKPTSENINE